MSDPILITDPADPRVADFRDLSRADRRPDRPGGRGLVIAEGTFVVRRMMTSNYPMRALLGVPRRFDELAAELADTAAPFYVASAEVMAQVVGFHLNRGVLATADRVVFPVAAELLTTASSVAVLEGVGDHENLGSIFRNAAALGLDAVLLAGGCADPLYRRSVRVSMGTVLAVPFATLAWPGDGLDLLRSKGFRLIAMTPTGEMTLAEAAAGIGTGTGTGTGRSVGADTGSGRRVAILVGSEGPGLTPEALRAADQRVRIPMAGDVDSLNVATAAAIAFATLVRPKALPGQ